MDARPISFCNEDNGCQKWLPHLNCASVSTTRLWTQQSNVREIKVSRSCYAGVWQNGKRTFFPRKFNTTNAVGPCLRLFAVSYYLNYNAQCSYRPLDNMTTLAVSSARAIWRRASARIWAQKVPRGSTVSHWNPTGICVHHLTKVCTQRCLKYSLAVGFFPHLTRVCSGSNNMQNN